MHYTKFSLQRAVLSAEHSMSLGSTPETALRPELSRCTESGSLQGEPDSNCSRGDGRELVEKTAVLLQRRSVSILEASPLGFLEWTHFCEW